jgi:hypothetical protein
MSACRCSTETMGRLRQGLALPVRASVLHALPGALGRERPGVLTPVSQGS